MVQVDGINQAAEERNQPISIKVGQKVHKNCRKDFTKKVYVRKRQAEEHDEPFSTTPLRSSKTVVNFRTHCLFCGNRANVQTNKKYEREEQDVFRVRTLLLQDSVTAASYREDKWEDEVSDRIRSVVDLPAAYELYSSSEKKKKTGRPEDIERKDAFFNVIDFLENGDEQLYPVWWIKWVSSYQDKKRTVLNI